MYSFSVNCSNAKKFNSVLGKGTSTYLSVFIYQGICYIMNEQIGIISLAKLQIITSDNMNDADKVLYFRIDKKKILKLIVDGRLDFLVDEEYITISFNNMNAEELYSYKFRKLQEDLTLFYKAIDATKDMDNFPKVNLTGINAMVKAAKNIKSNISFNGNTASCSDGLVGVYQVFKCPNKFVASPVGLESCMSVSNIITVTKHHMISKTGDFNVISSLYNYEEIDDIIFIRSLPSMCKVTFDISSLASLLSKLELKEGNFVLDFNLRTAKLVIGFNEFSVKFKIKDIKKADKNPDGSYRNVVLPKIILPYHVLTKIINPIKPKEVSLYIKKKKILIDTIPLEDENSYLAESNLSIVKNDMSIFFNRVDFNEN